MSTKNLADIDLDLRPSVSAGALRVVAGLAAGLAVLLVGFQGWRDAMRPNGLWDGFGSPQLTGWSVFFGIAASVWIVWRTQDHVAPVLSIGVGFAALAMDGGISWRTFLLAGLLIVMLRSAALAGGLAWDARIELDVLRPVVRSTAGVFLAVLVAGAVAGFLDGSSGPDPGMKLIGLGAVIVAAIWLLPKYWARSEASRRRR